MSHSHEVLVLMRPIWSALPLFGSGTKSRIRVPAVIPKTGDTYNIRTREKERVNTDDELTHNTDMMFRERVVQRGRPAGQRTVTV